MGENRQKQENYSHRNTYMPKFCVVIKHKLEIWYYAYSFTLIIHLQ